ncbi:MAG: hypothetical protein IGBAC_1579 [Ignavibacteriae bacterium]|nr:MAG: hypothetical protein IGBAC_1579 [Ignavibacteriota bacterium]
MYEKPDKFIPALYGGIIIGIISSVPFLNFINCLCCAGVIIGGILSVYFYKQNFTPDTPPYTSGDCLMVGLYAGIIGAIISTIFSIIFLMLFGNVVGEFILEYLRTAEIELPEETFDAIEKALAQQLTFFSIITDLVASLILYSIFGLLGGVIGYNIFKPKQTDNLPKINV